jgi:hypothetical protein
VAKITPDALAVLVRVKRYGLGTWRPGRLVISNARDETFAQTHSATITTLIEEGYLAVDHFGSVSTGLAGEHELRGHAASLASGLHESRLTIAGRRFQVITEGWQSETEAANARRGILDGLTALAEVNPGDFEDVYRAALDGLENDCITRVVVAATGSARAAEGQRVGIRIYGS